MVRPAGGILAAYSDAYFAKSAILHRSSHSRVGASGEPGAVHWALDHCGSCIDKITSAQAAYIRHGLTVDYLTTHEGLMLAAFAFAKDVVKLSCCMISSQPEPPNCAVSLTTMLN